MVVIDGKYEYFLKDEEHFKEVHQHTLVRPQTVPGPRVVTPDGQLTRLDYLRGAHGVHANFIADPRLLLQYTGVHADHLAADGPRQASKKKKGGNDMHIVGVKAPSNGKVSALDKRKKGGGVSTFSSRRPPYWEQLMKFDLTQATTLQKSVHELLIGVTTQRVYRVGHLMVEENMPPEKLPDVVDTIVKHGEIPKVAMHGLANLVRDAIKYITTDKNDEESLTASELKVVDSGFLAAIYKKILSRTIPSSNLYMIIKRFRENFFAASSQGELLESMGDWSRVTLERLDVVLYSGEFSCNQLRMLEDLPKVSACDHIISKKMPPSNIKMTEPRTQMMMRVAQRLEHSFEGILNWKVEIFTELKRMKAEDAALQKSLDVYRKRNYDLVQKHKKLKSQWDNIAEIQEEKRLRALRERKKLEDSARSNEENLVHLRTTKLKV